ncbi:hypothetical protein Tdes44962_MAKER08984 [Teratosphaeria destructans]|uniref:Uncharacterized protein n=1 Tax=Teratosphaeria destructans TaxID=418781 RepID=A0A9W7SUN9_9PEZI|nr:hypothetical protein Tdes44962_MAKER08984 [Teratosphaeria destructans]
MKRQQRFDPKLSPLYSHFEALFPDQVSGLLPTPSDSSQEDSQRDDVDATDMVSGSSKHEPDMPIRLLDDDETAQATSSQNRAIGDRNDTMAHIAPLIQDDVFDEGSGADLPSPDVIEDGTVTNRQDELPADDDDGNAQDESMPEQEHDPDAHAPSGATAELSDAGRQAQFERQNSMKPKFSRLQTVRSFATLQSKKSIDVLRKVHSVATSKSSTTARTGTTFATKTTVDSDVSVVEKTAALVDNAAATPNHRPNSRRMASLATQYKCASYNDASPDLIGTKLRLMPWYTPTQVKSAMCRHVADMDIERKPVPAKRFVAQSEYELQDMGMMLAHPYTGDMYKPPSITFAYVISQHAYRENLLDLYRTAIDNGQVWAPLYGVNSWHHIEAQVVKGLERQAAEERRARKDAKRRRSIERSSIPNSDSTTRQADRSAQKEAWDRKIEIRRRRSAERALRKQQAADVKVRRRER